MEQNNQNKKCYIVQASFGWPYDDYTYDKIIGVYLNKEEAEKTQQELSNYYEEEFDLTSDANEIYNEVLSDYFDNPDISDEEYDRREQEDFNENFVLYEIWKNRENLEKKYREKYNTIEKMQKIADSIVHQKETSIYGPASIYPVIEVDLFE